jgi:hypothetical protein
LGRVMEEDSWNEEATSLIEEVREAKRLQHQARRRARSASSKLDELKRKCKEYGIRLVIDGKEIT